MTAPLLSDVDVPCPDCNGTGGFFRDGNARDQTTGTPHFPPKDPTVLCSRCEGRGTVQRLFFTCPTCSGAGTMHTDTYEGTTHGGFVPCNDPNHGLHGPVTLARLKAIYPPGAPFRIEAEWQAP